MEPQPKKPRKRSRLSNGRFAKSKEIEAGLKKSVDITIKKKIDAPTDAKKSAGKYAQQEKITPSFGTIRTTLH